MCTGIELALLATAAVGAGTSAYGAHQQGKAQNEAAIAQGEQLATQAGQEEDAAAAQAERIRRAGREQQGAAKAALSASGVSSDVGTALKIQEDIIRDSESDALQTIIGGGRRGESLSDQAVIVRQQGRSARRAGNIAAAGTLLSTAGSYANASGWKGGSGVKVNA